MTDTQQEVATERTVIRNPAIDDPNAGIIVAAGDPIPAGVGLVQNTPNKVDAAANYEEADAADKAGAGARPATRVVSGSALSPEARAQQQEIVDRVSENRSSWDQEQRRLGEQAAAPADGLTSTARAPEAEPDAFDPSTATGKELDARYGGVDGYDARAKVADRQAWAVDYENARGQ